MKRSALLLVSVCAPAVFGQSYTISTVVGAALPPANIPGTSASFPSLMPSYVTADSAGNVFFVAQNAVIERSAATGLLTVVAGNGTTGYSGDNGPATSAQLGNPGGLAVATDGTLYIADTQNFVIRKVSGGVITTFAGNGNQETSASCPNAAAAADAQFYNPGALALDSHGNLYVADGFCLFKISAGMVTNVAGSISGNFSGISGDGGPATAAVIDAYAIATDSTGNIYLQDSGEVREVTTATGKINAVPGTANFAGCSTNTSGPASSVAGDGVAVDSHGNVYFSDWGNNVVCEVTNGNLSTVAGSNTLGGGFSGDGGAATKAQLSTPGTLALDGNGNLYICDLGNSRIREVSDGTINTIAGNGLIGDNGPASKAILGFAAGLALDSSGNLYIADFFAARVRKVDAVTGIITTIAGNGTSGTTVTDGSPATSVGLNSPHAVAVDNSGDVFIAESGLGNILRVSGGLIYNFAGTGTLGDSGNGGPAISAGIGSDFGLATDANNNLYLSDNDPNDPFLVSVRVISNGIINAFAGNGQYGASGDGGPATSAELNLPSGLRVDSLGNLYIVDVYNNNVREVSGGIINTVAGNANYMGFAGDGGPATSAQLNSPNGIGVDKQGNLFIADVSNNRVRMVSAATGIITTVAGNGQPNSYLANSGYSGDGGPATSAELGGPFDAVVTSAGIVLVADSEGHVRALIPNPAPCSFSGVPATLPVAAAGGNQTIAVATTAFASCSWSISGLPSWIALASPSPTTGSGNAILSIAANTGGARSATITIAGIGIAVTQAGAQGSTNPCDVNQDGVVNVLDVQLLIKQSLGLLTAANDLNGDGVVNIVDVQIDSDAVLNLGCSAQQ